MSWRVRRDGKETAENNVSMQPNGNQQTYHGAVKYVTGEGQLIMSNSKRRKKGKKKGQHSMVPLGRGQ